MAHIIPTLATILVALLFLSPPTAANSPVLDTDGNPLEVGSQYYVLTSGTRGAGRGGLAPVSGPKQLCPRYVAQYRWWTDRGSPVRLTPADNPSGSQRITEDEDVNISFSPANYCRESGVWTLTLDPKARVPYVATNGDPEAAAASTTRFKIVKISDFPDYKIVYCFLRPVPGIVGNEEDCQQLDATQRGPIDSAAYLSLVPLNQPLPFFGFVFKKATN